MTSIALITGANRGLGLETARRLARSGAHVVLGARDPAAGEQAAGQFRAQGLDAATVTLDVTDVASIRAAAAEIDHRHGRLDILVNNAGILPEATAVGASQPLDLRLFEQTYATNVLGAVAVTQELLPLLRRSDAGRIVNVSSTMGSLADQSDPASPYFGLVVPAYQSSKAALNSLTIALAKVLADTPIKVSSVCPGWVQTDLGGPDNRAAAPTTAADASLVVVEMALLPDDAPSGRFVDRDGIVAW
jgi:NAD(P)-dependent dehydrogenase (short-subunit alcohol dehydrogenase family)